MYVEILLTECFGAIALLTLKDCCEILTGVESAYKCDVGDAFVRFGFKDFSCCFDALIIKILHGGHVRKLLAYACEVGDAEVAMLRHGVNGPLLL